MFVIRYYLIALLFDGIVCSLSVIKYKYNIHGYHLYTVQRIECYASYLTTLSVYNVGS
jgi:hypothetical protein